MSVALSTMARLFGFSGLLLVPIGAFWLIHEFRRRALDSEHVAKHWGYQFGSLSLIASSIVALTVSFGAFATVGSALAIAVLISWGLICYQLKRKFSVTKIQEASNFRWAPVYLTFVPIVLTTAWLGFGHSASEFSRNRVIENSTALITDIERYREKHGQYPLTLQSLWEDYKPSMKGVARFHYEPNEDAYNLYFEHPSISFGTREIVMYNRESKHEFTSHNMDLLRLPSSTIRRGYHEAHDLATPNWRRFLFD